MCDPGTLTLVATATAVAGTVASTAATYQQKRYEARLADENTRRENDRIVDAMNRGDLAARDSARRSSQLLGAQRAAMAANGIDVGYGSADALLGDTASYAWEEQSVVRENTRREILGYDINAANFKAGARAARSAATGALVAGGLQVASTLAGGAQRYGSIQAGRSGALAGAGG